LPMQPNPERAAGDDDRADDDGLIVELQPEQVEPLVEQDDDRGAGERAEDAAVAAEDVGAAQHDGGDRHQQQVVAEDRAAGAEPEAAGDPRQAGGPAAQQIGEELGADHAQAAELGRPLVAADQEQLAAEFAVAQDDGGDAEDQGGEPQQVRHAEKV